MTPTAYIPTKITINDKPAKGWIIALTKEGRGVPFYFDGSDISFITMRDQYDVWLRPVDLSRMLEDCWNAAVDSVKDATGMGHKYDDIWIEHDDKAIEADKAEYFNSVLNPPK